MEELRARLHGARTRAAAHEARRQDRAAVITRLEAELADLQSEEELLAKVEQLLLLVSSKVLGRSITTIDKLVTTGLRLVFEDQSLEFKTSVEKYRGKTAIKFRLLEDGADAPLLDAYGGGVLAVASVLLRVVSITILGLRRVLFLDESLSHLSAQYIPNASRLMRKLCEELGFSIVMVTHQPEFAAHADMHYRAVRKQNATVFEVVRGEDDHGGKTATQSSESER